MKASIHTKLQSARPPLKLIAPLTYHICLGFVWVNIILGLGLFFLLDSSRLSSPLLLINNVLTFDVWGALFIGLAAFITYGLIKNNWELIKVSMLMGLTVKITWLTMLIIRVFENPSTILLVSIWLFFAYIQAITYIYFLPTQKGEHHAGIE